MNKLDASEDRQLLIRRLTRPLLISGEEVRSEATQGSSRGASEVSGPVVEVGEEAYWRGTRLPMKERPATTRPAPSTRLL
jgi:hypothetical protein